MFLFATRILPTFFKLLALRATSLVRQHKLHCAQHNFTCRRQTSLQLCFRKVALLNSVLNTDRRKANELESGFFLGCFLFWVRLFLALGQTSTKLLGSSKLLLSTLFSFSAFFKKARLTAEKVAVSISKIPTTSSFFTLSLLSIERYILSFFHFDDVTTL